MMQYYSDLNMEILTLATTWMNPKDVNKNKPIIKEKLLIIPFI